MVAKWQDLSLDELKGDQKSAFAMGPFGSRIKAENFVSSGVPILKGGNLNGSFINEENFDFLTEEKAEELKSSRAARGDLVVTHRGTIGQVGLIPEWSKFDGYIVSQSQLKLSFDRQKVNPYFIYYFFKTKDGQAKLLANASQVGVPALAQALTSIKKVRINLPEREEQNKIVDVLLGLDKKIHLIHKQNATFEMMAQAIFKSWFVDFDPVKAKAEGRRPEGMDAATAALFSSSFIDSPHGQIPEGWSISKVSDILDLAYGKALKSTDRLEGNVPVYGSGGITGFHSEHLVEGPGIVVGRKGTVGSLHWERNAFFPIDTVFYVIPKKGFSLGYIFYLLKTLGLENMNTDAAVPGLNRNNVYRLELPTPTQESLIQFDAIITELLRKIDFNQAQINVLSSTRDALLPRLISGKLRVGDDKQIIKDVA